MIDTIFYFCPTLELYEQTLAENGGEGISSKTITFVEDVREIYFNGRGYGKTSTAGLITDDQFETWKNTILVRLNLIISDAENDLKDLQTLLSTEIQDAIAQALQDQNGKSIWTKITETDEGVSAVTTQVSNLSNRLDNISTNGDIQYSAVLQSVIDEGIRNNTAFTNLQSRWAVLNENQAVLEWMASGFKSQVNENTNFATVFSAYLDEVDSNLSTIAALQTKANANEAKLNAIANWNGYVEGLPVSYYGGLVTSSNIDGAIAALIANSNTDTSAAITANVTRNTSNITLTADKIYLDADTTLANTIQATQGSIGGFTISQNSLSAELGDYRIELTPLHFATYYNNTVTNEIKSTGSGSIASGGISWTNDGTITLSLEFLRSLFNELHNGAVNLDVYGGVNETFVIDQGVRNTGGDYVDNLAEVRSESSLWENSFQPNYRMNYISKYQFYDNTSRPQNYPFSGTLAEKQNWFVRNYSTVGKFVSGILTEKTHVDPETGLEKEELSELYIDHHINIVHAPTLTEFAQNNGLDINKFVGYAMNSSFGADPYFNGVRYEVTSYLTYSGTYKDSWNTLIYAYGSGNHDVLLILDGTILFVENSSFPQEVLVPYVFRNPLEGSWGFVANVIVHISELSGTNVAYYNTLTPSDNVNNYPSWNNYSGGDLFLVKYTSGAWRLVTNITPVSETTVQYRANETE